MTERAEAIFDGPWAEDARDAEAWLREGRPLRGLEPKRVFQAHWERIPTERAAKLRASFDSALTSLMLADLAIMTGYVRRVDIEGPVRSAFQRLLSSEPARRYIDDYDYVAVRFLASRFGIDLGLSPAEPPEGLEAPTLFASFLAQFRDWYEDGELDVWLSFLDDFVVIENEAVRFERYLRSGQRPRDGVASERFDDLLAGLGAFLVNLYDIFAVIPTEVRPMFGLVHVYWIAAFFGYELENGRYVKNYIDWGPAVAKTPLVTEAGRLLWDASLATLKEVWRDTSALVENSRSHGMTTTKPAAPASKTAPTAVPRMAEVTIAAPAAASASAQAGPRKSH